MEGGGNIQDVQTSGSTEQEAGFQYSLTHPGGTLHRFIALFFMCFLGFGSYFCYDNPAALQDNFTKDLNITTTKFVLFYSLYSWPNVVLCFIGGFLIDRVFGIRLGTNIYMFITLLGQIIFASGVMTDVLWMMMLGRFIFGIGGESLAVAQNNYAVLWFKGKELNMVFGLQLSFARVGSSVNFWVMESVYEAVGEYWSGYECLGITLFIAGGTCILSMFCAMILGCLDKRAERILHRNINQEGELVQFSNIKDFPVTFWLITIICVSYYVAIFPFIALGKNFFMERFKLDPNTANSVNSIVYLISAVASPLLGLMVDKTGKNILYVLFSIVFTILAHLILAFTLLNPFIGMVIMGLAYSMLASGLWPLVSLLIPDYQLGTAYGICQAIQNLGLAVISILTGIIVDEGGYVMVEIFFIGSLSVCLLTTIIVWIVDNAKAGSLNMTPAQREQQQQTLLAAEVLEREKLLSVGVTSSMGSHDMQPTSDFQIRNRYLSRIGAPLPSNYSINSKGLTYRALR